MRGTSPEKATEETPLPSGEIEDVLDQHLEELLGNENEEKPDEMPDPEPEDDVLPEHVEDEGDAGWVYHIQHPFEELRGSEKVKAKDIARGLKKVRIPARLYAKHMRDMMKSDDDSMTRQLFNLACSMTKLPESVMERMDTRDYTVVLKLCRKRLEGNASAAPQESEPTSGGR
jgi:hypothetical protein